MSNQAIELLKRLRGWDMLTLERIADGPYWIGEIDKVLAAALRESAPPAPPRAQECQHRPVKVGKASFNPNSDLFWCGKCGAIQSTDGQEWAIPESAVVRGVAASSPTTI